MDPSIKATMFSATELYGKIARTHENLMLGVVKVTLGMVEARLLNLEKQWTKFDSQNDELLEHLDKLKGSEYFKQDIPALAEEAYLMNKGLLLDLKRSLQAKELAAASPSSETPASAPRTTLPRIQLPVFTGKYEDWPAFRDLFSSLIGRDAAAKPVEKLHYLKSCVKGEADLLIRNLPTTDGNYERAWQTLSAFYENKRLLVRAYLGNFLALPKMKGESAVEMRKIFHGIKTTISALESIRRPVNRCEDLFVYLAVELLDTRSRREWENLMGDSSEPPAYAVLEQFLERRLHTLESMFPVKGDGSTNKSGNGNGSAKSTRSNHTRKQEKAEAGRGRCTVCKADHFIMFCEDYKRKSAAERKLHVTESGLCVNCLGRHKVAECSSKRNCTACGERHHTSLHDAFRELVATTSHVIQPLKTKPVKVLLATARVRVADRHGGWHPARALIDQGSESSFVSERLTQRLQLPRVASAITILGVGGQTAGTARGRVSLMFQARSSATAMSVTALILPRLTLYTGMLADGTHLWPHIRDLELADPDYCSADPINVLLGADVYAHILEQGLRKGGAMEPVAQKTSLGWILSGAVEETSKLPVNSLQCQVEEDLASLVSRFWETEEIRQAGRPLSQDEIECEEHFRRTHSRASDGRYIVRLPVIEPLPDLSSTRNAAARSWKHSEKRFERDATLLTLYMDFMR